MLKNFREVVEVKEVFKKHNNAVIFPYGSATWSIKPLSDKGFQKRFDVLMKPYKRLAAKGKVDEERCSELLAVALSETIVTGWEGVYIDKEDMNEDFPNWKYKANEEGQCKVPYSRENCCLILSHVNYKDLLLWVKDMSTSEADYIIKTEKDNAKN